MFIRRFIFGLVAMACGGAYAQSETTALSVAVKIAQSSVCDPSMNCESVSKSSYAVSHSFEIPPAQAALINANTTVSLSSVNQLEVRVGDDPGYQDGDESATINTTGELQGLPIDTQVKLSWKNGTFKISAKGKNTFTLNSAMLTPVAFLTKVNAKPLPPGHPQATAYTETKLEDSGGVFAMSAGYAAYKGSTVIGISPAGDGLTRFTAQVTVKTKNLVAEPVF